MPDHVSAERRSHIMASVGTKNTKPEMIVRRTLHRLGYRFRLHRMDLPGKPDIVFPSRRKVIFVHGCYWHGHECRWGQLPKTKLEYWGPKIGVNRERDARNVAALESAGWSSHIVWQCELRSLPEAVERIVDFLDRE